MRTIMRKLGFTLMEIMIVVAIIALLAAIGVPRILNSYSESLEKTKDANVKILNAVKDQWAMDNNALDGASVTWNNLDPYLSADALSDFDVGSDSITINPVGTSARY